jgi:two-component system response regulator HydG/two-component system response regulator AtoC
MNLRNKLTFALIISLFIFTAETLKLPGFENANSFFYKLKFKLRGEKPIDSSIVFLYIDDTAIHELGGYPLKRSYYALLIDMLTQLNVKAIAFDILFNERNLDYPERDQLLVFTTKRSGRVFLGTSFANLGNPDTAMPSDILRKFTIKSSDKNLNFPAGSGFSAPFDELLQNCAGIGHLNYISRDFPTEIPMLISLGKDEFIYSISLELAHAYFDIPKDSTRISKDKIFLGHITIPLKNGNMLINYIGGAKSLRMYSAIDFIKSYDSLKTSNAFKNKIVFIGIFSEALRQTLQTPFDEKFPSTGIHILALNTIIQQKFLTEVSPIFNFFFSFIFSSLLIGLILTQRTPKVIKFFVLPVLITLIFLVLAVVLFIFDISISVYPFFAIFLSTFFGMVYSLEIEHKRAVEIENERRKIESLIKEKELKIIELQNELESLRSSDEKTKALSNLGVIYDEIKELTSKFEDLYEFGTGESERCINFEGIVYASGGKMEKIISIIKKVAPSDVPVLITGENGVGKELVAMAIHNLSERRNKKFIPINCSAIPETLLESELFGYERGAFTGATQRKNGLFEHANGGTIFLDEIAETTEAFQTKILRILQSGEFTRIGGTEILKVDVRIIAATNRDIEKAVNEGKFREDLYYRLNVVRIHIPPLRDRKEDIPFLVEHFLKKFKADDLKISQAVMSAFLNYDWPGNIRQLENAIKRAIIFAKSDGRKLIQLKDLPDEIVKSTQKRGELEEQILNLLREKKFSHSSISETANELGLNRGTVAEYLRGICFRSLCENNFDIDKASAKIANNEPESTKRVRKKIIEYIQSFVENIDQYKSVEEIRFFIKSKYKNLPARYHFYLEEFALKLHKGEITVEKFNLNAGEI